MNDPVIILVRPQLGENIGMCARAMLNCGLTEMRIVAPRDGWPNESAIAASAGADEILKNVRVYASLAEAGADLHHMIGTTNRLRDMVKPILSPVCAVGTMQDAIGKGERVGLVFGPERTGLENEDIIPCSAVLCIPLNPEFSSLNLAQAVLLVGWEWARVMKYGDRPHSELAMADSQIASTNELNFFFKKLDHHLEEKGFFRTEEKRPTIWQNIRNIFTRTPLTSQEIQILHGIVTSLSGVKPPQS